MTKPHRKNERKRLDKSALAGSGSLQGPERLCAVTRKSGSQSQLLRFVAGPDGQVVPDLRNKLPGRGIWLTPDRGILTKAVKTKAFARGLKQPVSVPDALPDLVENLLLKQCQSLLGMARRAGDMVLGFDQVRDALRKAEPGWLLEASDGSEDSRNKVYFLAKALYEDVNVAGALTSGELGMAFGRPDVIHGLIQSGDLSRHWAEAYGRLVGFRQAPETIWFSRDRAG